MKISRLTPFLILLFILYLVIAPYIIPNHNGEKGTSQNQGVVKVGTEFKESDARWIGKTLAEAKAELGNEKEQYLGQFDYTWYSFSESNRMLELAVHEDKIVSVFSGGTLANLSPFQYKDSYMDVNETYHLNEKVEVQYENASYTFELSSEDLQTRPLVLTGDLVAQLYFDKDLKELVGVRYLTKEQLIVQKPYSVVFSGRLIEAPPLNQEKQLQVDEGTEYQILTFSNFLRNELDVPSLKYDPKLSQIALLHSEDMKENDYFSHTSPTRGGLQDRLDTGSYPFSMAGENIAAHYVDGLDVTLGWLNSPKHRVNLLSADFQLIGIGVSKDYYTQDFATK